MASDKVKQLLRDKLAEIRADNPGREDWFRLSKSGDSIAEFGPRPDGSERPDGSGVMLYFSYIMLDDRIVRTVEEIDGRLIGSRVEAKEYEGFPDPPQTEPRFAVGDRVRMTCGDSSVGHVKEVRTHRGYDREWYHRVAIATDDGGWYEAAERFFEPVVIVDPASIVTVDQI